MRDLLVNNAFTISMILAFISLTASGFLIAYIKGKSKGNDRMKEIASTIEEGAKAYLQRQVITISIIAGFIFFLLMWFYSLDTSIGFLVGAFCSLSAGYLGMRVAVMSNVRTTNAASSGEGFALRVAFNGGAVTGLLVIGLSLLSVGLFYKFTEDMTSLIGLALGSSLISVFARLGGGIYTKAADVGADLVGKIESSMAEDDPRNPAVIADNVGDNVGDCAGMAADVFETYAVSLIGAMIVGKLTYGTDSAVIFPLMLGGISVIGALLGILYVNIAKGNASGILLGAVVISAITSVVLYFPATQYLFEGNGNYPVINYYYASIVGLIMTAVVVVITDYYTSTSYGPVRKIAKSSETGHATNIIAGLAVGQHATAMPVGFIGVAILLSFHFAGLYGIAIAVVSMLSMAGIIISLDAFGPITDNAGGIAVMAGLDKKVREITDKLDAVGNTMKAVTKGYAIASAGLAALVLFGSYVEELAVQTVFKSMPFSLKDPHVIVGLFIGGLLPFVFTAHGLDAVGKAAGSVVREVRRQLKEKPGIITGKERPDYAACVDIVTKAALREMIIPALLPVVVTVGVAWLLGPVVLGGVLVGTIVTGLFVAIAMTSSGGAWDNAKKYIEEGNHGGKGSAAHAAAVTGDTVGDPYKDTAGPAVNPMIKVVNLVAILIIPLFFKK